MPRLYLPYAFPDAEKERYHKHGIARIVLREMQRSKASYSIELWELQEQDLYISPVNMIWKQSHPSRIVLASYDFVSKPNSDLPSNNLKLNVKVEKLELRLNQMFAPRDEELGYYELSKHISARVLL
jgi:hypothetical protein